MGLSLEKALGESACEHGGHCMLVFHYSPDVVSENRFVKVGKKKLRLLVVRLKKEAQAAARGEAKPPCVLWIHGGGYMIGSAAGLWLCRRIIRCLRLPRIHRR